MAQALAGDAATSRLEAEAAPDAGPGADRAALKGDLHLHSTWSDGGADRGDARKAAAPVTSMALTDHSPRLKVAKGLTADRLREQLEVVAAPNEELAPFRILTGIEVDILEDGTLDQDDGLLAELDLVVARCTRSCACPSSP